MSSKVYMAKHLSLKSSRQPIWFTAFGTEKGLAWEGGVGVVIG